MEQWLDFILFLWMWRKIHKTKPWINQVCKEIHTATLGMKLTSVVWKLEIKINLSKSKVKLHPYYKSIPTTKCVIFPLLKINMHHEMSNRAPTPNRYAPSARTWTRGLQHVNWVCRPLHHQSLCHEGCCMTKILPETLRLAIERETTNHNLLVRTTNLFLSLSL